MDVGGTFTDVVVFDGRSIRGRKVPTSPNQADGVTAAVSGQRDDVFLHGTTAATNALLEERGARVAGVSVLIDRATGCRARAGQGNTTFEVFEQDNMPEPCDLAEDLPDIFNDAFGTDPDPEEGSEEEAEPLF